MLPSLDVTQFWAIWNKPPSSNLLMCCHCLAPGTVFQMIVLLFDCGRASLLLHKDISLSAPVLTHRLYKENESQQHIKELTRIQIFIYHNHICYKYPFLFVSRFSAFEIYLGQPPILLFCFNNTLHTRSACFITLVYKS